MTPNNRRVILAKRCDLERHTSLAPKRNCLLLDNLAADRQRIGKIDLVEALRIGTRGWIAVVNAIDILDQPAARTQLLRQEERREIRSATPEQRHPPKPVASHESGNDGDAPEREGVFDGEYVSAHRLGVVRRR